MRQKTNFKYDEITLDGIGTFRVKKAEKGFVANETDTMQIMPSLFMFVPDVTDAVNSLNEMLAQMGEVERPTCMIIMALILHVAKRNRRKFITVSWIR